MHGTTKVAGERDRIVLSLGALVHKDDVKILSKKIEWDYKEPKYIEIF